LWQINMMMMVVVVVAMMMIEMPVVGRLSLVNIYLDCGMLIS